MDNHQKPFLCGGTFFVLLLRARKARSKARDKQSGGSDGLKDSDIMSGLNYIITGRYLEAHPSSIIKSTSLYKECQINGDTYITFNQKDVALRFKEELSTDYISVFNRTTDFIERYLDESKKVLLVKALLEILRDDSSITEDESVYLLGHNVCDKRHLLNQKELYLQPLIIGLINFILQKRANRNEEGYDTLESWGTKRPHQERNVKDYPFGASIHSDITVLIYPRIDKQSNEDYQNKVNDPYSPHPGYLPIINPESDLAPDLAILSESPIFWIEKDIVGDIIEEDDSEIDHSFDAYLTAAYAKYEKLRTLLHPYEPECLKEFYVCNSIERKSLKPGKLFVYDTKIYKDATAQKLRDCSNFIIIKGTGGLGKTMMMRHLLLDAIENYQEYHLLPVFVPLKNYSLSYTSILDYVYERFDSLQGGKSIEEFERVLKSGSCLLLFDGLDEINSDYRKAFEQQLEAFTDKYSGNMFVMSSRPYIRMIQFQRFTVLELQPFTKEQALTLIDKLNFRSDEPSIKEQFRSELDRSLFYSHREFSQNPLLLTIMLMTYEQYAKIPSKMHKFYHEAYETLAQKHDATKSAYSRSFKTGLDKDRFSDYFAEFCAVTYYNQKYDLTEEEFRDFFNGLYVREEDGNDISYKDFLDDLCSGMCLMYPEGNKYHFMHRSFQEYFCALFFSQQMDENLMEIAKEAFEGNNARPGDKTFSMLYDMITPKVEKHIFIPYLKELITECASKNGYYSYLLKMHPDVTYEYGEQDRFSPNHPESFICDFILSLQKDIPSFWEFSLPFYDEFVIQEYVLYDEDYKIVYEDGYDLSEPGDSPELHPKDDVDDEYIEHFGSPEVVGWDLEFHMSTVLANPDKYEELLKLFNADSFVFNIEYKRLEEYLAELQEKNTIEKTGTLFDRLHWKGPRRK